MKKVLSMALALMMLISMICAIPVMADEADGTAANPYYVANPMSAPDFITIPANSTVYYQYNVMVFNGWSVEGYGLTAIIVDGVVYDTPDMWGSLYADFNFDMISPGLVGYVNDTAEAVDVMLTHNEPVGSLDNPDGLDNGDNYFSIPAGIMEYVSVFLPSVSGDYTFSTRQAEDFQIVVYADASPAEGGTPISVENGSLTLTLESYMPVYVVITPVGMTGDVILNVEPPKAGTETNPVWLDAYVMDVTYAVEANTNLYFQIDGSLVGNDMTIESVAGAEFVANIGGVAYASEGGVLTVALASEDWYIDMFAFSAVDNELAFSVAFAAGSMENPIEIGLGNTSVSVPAGTDSGYFYTFVVEQDGLLVATPSDKSGIGYMDLADESYEHYSYMIPDSLNSTLMIPVTAGELITINVAGLEDEDTWVKYAVDFTLKLELKDLVLFNTFENYDLEGWDSGSDLILDENEYAVGWASMQFGATKDWANIFHYVNVEANTDYEISFMAKASLEKGLWIKLNKDWVADVAQADLNLTSEWTEYTVTLNSGDNTSLILMFQYAGAAADGQIIWLDDVVMTKYVAPSEPDQPDQPDEPNTPDEPTDPETPDEPNQPDQPDQPTEDDDEPESPATGDVTSFGAIAVLMVSALGTLTFSKKRK